MKKQTKSKHIEREHKGIHTNTTKNKRKRSIEKSQTRRHQKLPKTNVAVNV